MISLCLLAGLGVALAISVGHADRWGAAFSRTNDRVTGKSAANASPFRHIEKNAMRGWLLNLLRAALLVPLGYFVFFRENTVPEWIVFVGALCLADVLLRRRW